MNSKASAELHGARGTKHGSGAGFNAGCPRAMMRVELGRHLPMVGVTTPACSAEAPSSVGTQASCAQVFEKCWQESIEKHPGSAKRRNWRRRRGDQRQRRSEHTSGSFW